VWFVEKELRGYLACGILAHGFARLRCDACHREHLVAFSCKGRGICPSCAGRRMHDTAAHLVDRVLPRAPIRQWVLAFPAWARPALAYHPTLLGETLTRFIRALFAFQRRRARELGLPTTRARTSGAITFVQRFGFSLHADRVVPENDRQGLEQLCRYGLRPAVSAERLISPKTAASSTTSSAPSPTAPIRSSLPPTLCCAASPH